MSEGPPVSTSAPAAGLCAGCRHAEFLRSRRSAFLRCARAAADPRYPRYPGLPVLTCPGFESVPAREVGERAPGG
ncbi:MAG: hypothetical protein ABI689_03845 [Thermoanaerobaculia bacterium]